MEFRARTGSDFHAGEEFERLLKSVQTMEQSDGIVSAVDCLSEIVRGGLNRVRRLLERSGMPQIWIFKDRGFRMALNVPGDGRAQTFDITLLLSAFCDTDSRQEAETRPGFMAIASERSQTGRDEMWEL